MPNTTHVLVERRENIVTVTLNRPEKLNAFNAPMFDDLCDAVIAADQDPQVRCIVLTGNGRAFSAGGDMAAFKEGLERGRSEGRPANYGSVDQARLEQFAVAMGQLSTPTIAALHGPALGLGFTLPLACDIRIAAEDTTLGALFVRLGVTPEMGATFNLPRLVGIAKACELVLNATVLTAREALEIGLVNRVVPNGQDLSSAMEMAKNIASMPALAVRLAKENLYRGIQSPLSMQARAEIMANRVCRVSPDHEEAVDAFLQKRKPAFKSPKW